MSAPVSFTLDFEDLRTSPAQESRVGPVTDALLGRLAELGIRGTMFCVADVAARHPRLIARMVDDGHEIGVHGLHHTPNDLLGPERFARETARAKEILEDLSGAPVTLYRAPQYSLVPRTYWATYLLADLGFTVSSSVLPAASPLYGWPGAPTTPFRWPSGVVELPSPVTRIGPATIPFLGGTYLRLLPNAVRSRGLRRTEPGSVLWTYCHPWEFDPDESFYVYEHGGWAVSRLGWMNRRGMMRRVERLMAAERGAPLGEVAAALGEVPVFDPASGPDAADLALPDPSALTLGSSGHGSSEHGSSEHGLPVHAR